MSLRKYVGHYYSIIDSYGINNKIILTIQIFNFRGKIVTEKIIDNEKKNFPHNPKKLFLFEFNHENQKIYSKLISNEWYQIDYKAYPTLEIKKEIKKEEKYKEIKIEQKPRKIINGILIN